MAVPSFLFGGSTNETPQSIKQKRDLVRALMGASSAPKNIGEGLNALGDGIVANVLDRRANAAEAAGQSAANSLFNSILGNSSASPATTPSIPAAPQFGAASAPSNPNVGSTIDFARGEDSGGTDAAGIQSYIKDAALKRGIDPNVALRVAGSEGGFSNPIQQSNYVKNGVRETSYGPFQLRIGGGLGDAALKAGIDPRDPNQWKQGVDFALDQAAAGGWSPWYGAAKVGVGARTGLDKARALGMQPTQVASLDPSAGMSEQPAQKPYVDPQVTTAYAPQQPQTPAAQAIQQQAPSLPPPRNVATPPSPPQQIQQVQAPRPMQVAQNGPFGGVDLRLLQALQNPWLNEGQKAAVELLIRQQQQAAQQASEEQTWKAREEYKLAQEKADPSYQLDQDYKKAQLEALKAKTGKRSNVTNLGDGWLYDNDTHEAFRPQDEVKKAGGTGFRFGGNSVEAQALNGLIESGQITEGQAQELGAGKTISDPSTGAMMFLTPQGIFRQQGQQQPAQVSQQQTVDLFGENAQQPPQGVDLFGTSANPPAAATAPSPVAPTTQAADAVSANNAGIIPLTGGKPQKLLSEAERKNQSLFSVIKPELKTVEDNFDALSNPKNQAYSRLPFSEFATTPEYQKAANSLQTIVSSYLYSVSGATATPEEVRKQTDILTPRPGESKESIDNKKRRIRTMVNAVAQAGSLPPLEEPAAPAGNSADLQAARDAIARGAPRDKVIQRLRDANIDPTGL